MTPTVESGTGPRKKILVITEVFYPEQFLINDLVFEWQRRGMEVSVLTRNPSYPFGRSFPGYRNRLFTREVVDGVAVSRVQFIPGYTGNRWIKVLNYFWNMALAWGWVMRNGRRFDAVFVCQTGPLTFSSAGVLLRKRYRVPAAIWVQDLWPDTVIAAGVASKGLFRGILERFVHWCYSGFDTLAVASPGFAGRLGNYAPGKTIGFIPQWAPRVNEPVGEKDGSIGNLPGLFNFVFAGNIGTVQNLENVLRGFLLYQQSASGNPDVWLNLVGDGVMLAQLKRLAADLAVPSVKFWGRLDMTAMPRLYRLADVLVISLEDHPVYNLTLPAKFQAYLAAGKPIFGVIGGETAGMIRGHNLGWVADPTDTADIARMFGVIAATDGAGRLEKTEQAARLLDSHFDRERLIGQLTRMISEP